MQNFCNGKQPFFFPGVSARCFIKFKNQYLVLFKVFLFDDVSGWCENSFVTAKTDNLSVSAVWHTL